MPPTNVSVPQVVPSPSQLHQDSSQEPPDPRPLGLAVGITLRPRAQARAAPARAQGATQQEKKPSPAETLEGAHANAMDLEIHDSRMIDAGFGSVKSVVSELSHIHAVAAGEDGWSSANGWSSAKDIARAPRYVQHKAFPAQPVARAPVHRPHSSHSSSGLLGFSATVDAYRESWTQASRPVQCLRPGMLVRTAKQKNRSAFNDSRARCRDLLFLQGEVRQIGTEDTSPSNVRSPSFHSSLRPIASINSAADTAAGRGEHEARTHFPAHLYPYSLLPGRVNTRMIGQRVLAPRQAQAPQQEWEGVRFDYVRASQVADVSRPASRRERCWPAGRPAAFQDRERAPGAMAAEFGSPEPVSRLDDQRHDRLGIGMGQKGQLEGETNGGLFHVEIPGEGGGEENMVSWEM